MDKKLTDQYYAMLEKFECGDITRQEWCEYCTMILGVLMEENKEVFVRLKNR